MALRNGLASVRWLTAAPKGTEALTVFVPTDCPRRAAVDEGVAVARRKQGWKKLDFKKFNVYLSI